MVFTCAWSSSPPSVSWLKLTLDPEWCLVRVCAGWQGRRGRSVSDERAVSCDVSLGSVPSASWVEDSGGRQRRASTSWTWGAVIKVKAEHTAVKGVYYLGTIINLILMSASTNLIPVIIRLHSTVGIDRQVVSQVILTVVRWLYSSTEEQHSLWTGIRPWQDTLLVHTTQHLIQQKSL